MKLFFTIKSINYFLEYNEPNLDWYKQNQVNKSFIKSIPAIGYLYNHLNEELYASNILFLNKSKDIQTFNHKLNVYTIHLIHSLEKNTNKKIHLYQQDYLYKAKPINNWTFTNGCDKLFFTRYGAIAGYLYNKILKYENKDNKQLFDYIDNLYNNIKDNII